MLKTKPPRLDGGLELYALALMPGMEVQRAFSDLRSAAAIVGLRPGAVRFLATAHGSFTNVLNGLKTNSPKLTERTSCYRLFDNRRGRECPLLFG
jgi:hypothetical protein